MDTENYMLTPSELIRELRVKLSNAQVEVVATRSQTAIAMKKYDKAVNALRTITIGALPGGYMADVDSSMYARSVLFDLGELK